MKQIISFYYRHRKLCLLGIIFLIGLAWYFEPQTVLAQGADAEDADIGSIVKDVNKYFLILLRFSSAWLWPVILMIGSLLDNELIFGGAMGDRLLNIWVQIRNIVNIIFVLILLAIALYNVLGLGEEGGGLPLAFKTVLPKFVLALVAVNFSFLAAKVVLDFTNVVTGAVFALPTTAIEGEGKDIAQIAEKFLCATASKEASLKHGMCDGDKLNDRAKALFSRLDRSNITLAYALRFGKGINLKFIREGVKEIGQLTFNIIFNAVLYVVYAVSFIVLFLVLLLRVVALWVGVVLSPFIALGIVLPNLKELAGEAGGLREKFIANAIAPIKIGLVLSIGYIMMDGFEADKSNQLSAMTLTAIDPNALPTDINDLQQLMIAVAMVVIVWVGVFAGAEKTAAQGITNFIKGHMEGFGKWMAKLPTYAQVIPAGAGKRMSLQQVMGTIKAPFLGFERKGAFYDKEAHLHNLSQYSEKGDVKGFLTAMKPGKLLDPKVMAELKKLSEHTRSGDNGELSKVLDPSINTPNEFINALEGVEQRSPLARAMLKDVGKENIRSALETEAQVHPPEAAPVGTAPAKMDSQQAVNQLTTVLPQQLAANPAFQPLGDVSTLQALQDALKALPPELRTEFVKVDKDGKVQPIAIDAVIAVNNIVKLSSGSDQSSIKGAIETAEAKKVDSNIITKAIQKSSLPDVTKNKSLEELKTPNTATQK